MPRYKNLSGDSRVVSYENTPDSITLTFEDGSRYLYTFASAGRADIDRMKALAEAGKGLGTFVARQVRGAFERKIK